MEGGEEKMTMGERYAQNNITVRIYKVKTNILKDRGISLCNSNGENLSVKPSLSKTHFHFLSLVWRDEEHCGFKRCHFKWLYQTFSSLNKSLPVLELDKYYIGKNLKTGHMVACKRLAAFS